MTILIVDDDLPTIQAISDSLNWPMLSVTRVETASNVSAAKRLIEELSPEIILCDIEMPKYSGIDLLKWVRDNKYESEFIFLTCHEEFSYAAEAIRYEASAYITKPFDVASLSAEIMKAAEKINSRNEIKLRSAYGDLWLSGKESFEKALWREIVLTDKAGERRFAGQSLNQKFVGIDPDKTYRLILCTVSETEAADAGWELPTFMFAIGNMACELLLGNPDSSRHFDYSKDGRLFIAVIDDGGTDLPAVTIKCEKLAEFCRQYLQCTPVCYIGDACPSTGLSAERRFWENYDAGNVGRNFRTVDRRCASHEDNTVYFLNTALLEDKLTNGRSIEAINLLRKEIEQLEKENRLTAQRLSIIHHDYMQLIYMLLYRENIQAHELFSDETSKKLLRASESSVFDMLRWASYMTDRALKYIEQMRQTGMTETIVARVKRYISENYLSDISREDIARSVFLSPDYVSRIFRAQTGYYLKDYVNEHRIEKAKELLSGGRKNISEVATAVGFDNFSYFSTLFRKNTGFSPSEYRKSRL